MHQRTHWFKCVLHRKATPLSPTHSKTTTMRRGSKKKPLSQTVEEYASRTSIHGISYIFDRQGQFLKQNILPKSCTGSRPLEIGLSGCLWWLPSSYLPLPSLGTIGPSGKSNRLNGCSRHDRYCEHYIIRVLHIYLSQFSSTVTIPINHINCEACNSWSRGLH